MLGPTRPLPKVGARARICHFGGEVELGVVSGVCEGGRRVLVRCESGELLEFSLSPATAKFVAAGDLHGASMELLEAATRARPPQGA